MVNSVVVSERLASPSRSHTVVYILGLSSCCISSCDIFSEVEEVKLVKSGFAHREEQQVEGEDLVVPTDTFTYFLLAHQDRK